ncbi:hypothetical protein [Nonomuraea solani]|uniref:hypothetical protein n=1 Tax=Nonomuraea solani TaxID=1144553 RepID=UPI0011AFF95F|nr:hypothetical protein [Nonomuraea solani]
MDGARRQLLADDLGGPWLARFSPLGAKRAVRHAALRLPRETGDPFVQVPAWTLALLSASSDSDQRISPAAWRLYALILAGRCAAGQPLETPVGHLGGMGSPQKAHDHKTSQLDASRPPAAGDVQVVDAQPLAPGRQVSPIRAAPLTARHPATTRQAAEVYRHALPASLAQAIPASGRRRVLTVIAAELANRTPVELAERIRRRWEPWQWREDIADVTSVAITIVRRGYHYPDLRCEDQHRLDTGQPCGACAEVAAEVVRRRVGASSPGERACVVAAASLSGPPPVHEMTIAADATASLGSPPYEDPAYQAARAKVRALGRREPGKAIVAERPGHMCGNRV